MWWSFSRWALVISGSFTSLAYAEDTNSKYIKCYQDIAYKSAASTPVAVSSKPNAVIIRSQRSGKNGYYAMTDKTHYFYQSNGASSGDVEIKLNIPNSKPVYVVDHKEKDATVFQMYALPFGGSDKFTELNGSDAMDDNSRSVFQQDLIQRIDAMVTDYKERIAYYKKEDAEYGAAPDQFKRERVLDMLTDFSGQTGASKPSVADADAFLKDQDKFFSEHPALAKEKDGITSYMKLRSWMPSAPRQDWYTLSLESCLKLDDKSVRTAAINAANNIKAIPEPNPVVSGDKKGANPNSPVAAPAK